MEKDMFNIMFWMFGQIVLDNCSAGLGSSIHLCGSYVEPGWLGWGGLLSQNMRMCYVELHNGDTLS